MCKCPFCDSQMTGHPKDEIYDSCDCPICGHYEINDNIGELDKDIYVKRHLISGYIREMNVNNYKVELKTKKSYENILAQGIIPKNIKDKFDKLLFYFSDHTKEFGQLIQVPVISVSYSKTKKEADSILNELLKHNYLEDEYSQPAHGKDQYRLTYKGMMYIDKNRKHTENRNQVFIALKYDEEIANTFLNVIKDLNFNPVIINNSEFNDSIIDQIIDQIRKSIFVVADLTGNRQNVYFEAGFAYGLGLNVIYTCKEKEKQDIHFDIQHNNIIFWKNRNDLYDRLKHRIGATIVK